MSFRELPRTSLYVAESACLQSFAGEGERVLGTSRLTRIPADPSAVWIESVVVHPELRGKGLGKYLMLKTEQGRRAAIMLSWL